ncbi:MAG: NUDIX domain-containing protein [Lachnospiraceae bacterium]|nr:NUDIX domain-containing protein [Lachnospiraceae bacterium]
MELLDTYHADHTPAGHVVRRGEIPQEGELFLVVHILLVNNSGKLLLQKRQDTKNQYPGCWDVSAGGYAQQGEASRPAVLRETQEELGFTPKEL